MPSPRFTGGLLMQRAARASASSRYATTMRVLPRGFHVAARYRHRCWPRLPPDCFFAGDRLSFADAGGDDSAHALSDDAFTASPILARHGAAPPPDGRRPAPAVDIERSSTAGDILYGARLSRHASLMGGDRFAHGASNRLLAPRSAPNIRVLMPKCRLDLFISA